MANRRSHCWVLAIVVALVLAERGSGDPVNNRRPPITSRIVVFLKEQCHHKRLLDDEDHSLLEQIVVERVKKNELHRDVEVVFLPKTVVCETKSRGLSAILDALAQETTMALIGSLQEDLCDVTSRLADMWGKPLLSWSCPQLTKGAQRLVPSLEETANAIVTVAKSLSWKSIVIITSDVGWWPVLANKIEVGLQDVGVAPRHIYWENDGHPTRALRGLQNTHSRVIILCSSLRSSVGETILQTIDNLGLSQSILLAIDVSSFIPFLPKIVDDDNKKFSKLDKDEAFSNYAPMFYSSLPSSKYVYYQNQSSSYNDSFDSNSTDEIIFEADNSSYKLVQKVIESVSSFKDTNTIRRKRSWPQDRFELFENISSETKKSFMILTSMDSKSIVSDMFMANTTQKSELYEHIMEGLNIILSGKSNDHKKKAFKFLFLDWKENSENQDSNWRPLMILQSNKNGSGSSSSGSSVLQRGDINLNMVKIQPHFDDWFNDRGLEYDEDSCDDDFCIRAQIKMKSTHIIIFVVSGIFFTILIFAVVMIMRNILLKMRLSKGPNKIVLTTTDFVFPQVPDSRRVDEGIEAMLCCWLQQLQEFGGPEVDKPDLLKGSVVSLKGPAAASNKVPSSNGSLAKNNYIVDHRIRYNGDFVQLKELPTVGTFELKSKAMDCLVLTHGLRHENLNPFIGCLTDPARPALVHEHCSRGSLEDVLMMDEIKLDWTFRLSLLTDLVRGMRYLHSTTLKVHGYLTSRNCVIDARWVLKVTDYGLPAFYEAQGIQPTARTARDLLWTAPELLRHCGLRRKGTQAGDVYSFAIIMQEVVVRGEPFCMLALTPEEIIEKVKKPPPLIRPSVSKGAAPPEAIHIMRQCWTEQPEMRPDFCQVHDLFRKLNHGRKVNFVDTMFQMLEKYSNNLEELIKERTEQLDMEKKKTEQLLNRMLPSYVAEKLKLGMPVDPEEFSEVSIYFSDIVGFTVISAHCTPFQVVDLLNDLYTCFDATINAYNVYKVETIGDAYMVVGGLPVKIPDHAEQVATMALDLLHQSGRFKIRHLPKTPLHLRIGLHTGPCCAGVVGLTMPRYCLFGDTVNTASRMESTGSAWRIHISQATRDKLEAAGGYSLEYRGKTEVKGKGRLPTYWLLGKAGFDKVLPSPPPIGESYCLEESLTPNPIGETSEKSTTQASPGHLHLNELDKHHFSIDKSFFSVENSSSPKSNNLNGIKTKTPTSTPKKEQEFEPIPTTISIDIEESHQSESQIKPQLNLSQLNHLTLGTPVSASDVAAALLGNASSFMVNNRYKDVAKYKRSLILDTNDLSSSYNYYRCLSPSDSNINQLNPGKSYGSAHNSGRMLKRQFSLDRADDSANAIPESNLAAQNIPKTQPKLCKQNSAGAATDLERIEEVPLANIQINLQSPRSYKRRLGNNATFPGCSKSVSDESLVTIDKR